MTSRKALDSPDSYAIAWIAALPIERAAAETMLDEENSTPTGFVRHQNDANVYSWGCVGEHNIVITSLAAGVYGTTSAATTASSLLASLPSIRVALLVGIGGGIARPDEGHDIRLGDIVVSQPNSTTGGVCQYDLFKAKSGDKREREGFLGRPPTVLLNALASIHASHERKNSKVPDFLREMLDKNPKMGKGSKKNPGYVHQGFDNDHLFQTMYDHVPGLDCRGCDVAEEVQRDPRDTTDPEIHYGIIASGNTLVKDAAIRDRMVAEVGEDCICFEMEAAGLMNHFPCLVVRGICDYADSHKNDRWQRYASATAAAYAKELLEYVPATEVQETKRALEVLQSVEKKINSVQQTTIATKAAADSIKSDLRIEKIKRWLCPPDPSTNVNHARKLRHEGTGAWLLENLVFQSWYSGSRRHIWLYGLAGCGKTVLSATVLDHLAQEKDHFVLSFFFDFSDTKKQTVDGMLRSLAFQLYQYGTGSAVLDATFQAHQDGLDQPATKILSDVVYKMLAAQNQVSIVIDALDESTTKDELLLSLNDVVSRPELGHVQLLCTSRPESEFLRGITSFIGKENCLVLDKRAVNADIQLYVTAQLSQRRDFQDKRLSQSLLEQIRTKVGQGADGMFRWAFCQLESLSRCRHEAGMEKALTSLPLNLDETYRRMIESIPPELKSDEIRLLQFLLHSERPLKLAEAVEVIATQIGNESRGFNKKRRLFCETDVLDYCPSLVAVVQATDKELHLAHFLVKEYLLNNNQLKITSANISITQTCLTYLTDIEGNYEEIEWNFPLAQFAAEVWTSHAASVKSSEEIVRVIIRFLEDEITFQRWRRLYQDSKARFEYPYHRPEGSQLYYTCLTGLALVAQYFITKGADVNAQGGYYGNALQAASAQGHQEIVKLLLAKNADVNAQGGYYGNALQAASARGHQEIVKLLLAKNADVNAQGGENGNALQAASAEGHQEIVKLLLAKDADVNAQGGFCGNALQAASAEGHQEIVKLLLAKDADVNVQGGFYGNALQAASAKGYQEIIKLLQRSIASKSPRKRSISISLSDFPNKRLVK
ncbi:Pfs, NACHT and ankyrin domain protein [Lasiosphaeria miniovina]|uniref:Pfs, NACHT and ankyrin domain protein n=1 Tax=Lasiosphaeria miniovina TaxID=1954250 RepID=A0AA40AT62_9PEZI|nr:Pfs, NACHT and ankyrin domain protein [Lasiosphaeria miniovina]KAK0721573.1 Pfs, NACHT and ankyrin domain protein [Lasiosphaeria miniovina]